MAHVPLLPAPGTKHPPRSRRPECRSRCLPEGPAYAQTADGRSDGCRDRWCGHTREVKSDRAFWIAIEFCTGRRRANPKSSRGSCGLLRLWQKVKIRDCSRDLQTKIRCSNTGCRTRRSYAHPIREWPSGTPFHSSLAVKPPAKLPMPLRSRESIVY